MIFLMLRNNRCGHLMGFNYQHRVFRGVVWICRCGVGYDD